MRRINIALAILLSFLITFTVQLSFDNNYVRMQDLNQYATEDKADKDTFVVRAVLNHSKSDINLMNELIMFSTKYNATINATYIGKPLINGRESMTTLTYGPHANDIFSKVFTENQETFDLSNAAETKILTNIKTDIAEYPQQVLIDSIVSKENILASSPVRFIGSFHYLNKLAENLDQSLFTISCNLAS